MGRNRGEMGVGTLIVFIAMLLVAAVAAGVLIQTTGSLQEKALSTGQQAKTQIATNVRIVEISATDGRSRSLTDFMEIAKLAPGSDPIKLDQMMLIFNTYEMTATLQYKGVNGTYVNDNTGYNTWVDQEFGQMRRFNYSNTASITFTTWLQLDFDIDGDFINDNVSTCRNGWGICDAIYDDFYIVFNLSATDTKTYVQLLDPAGAPVDILAAPDALGNDRTPIGSFAYMDTRGTTTSGSTLDAGQLVIYLDEPYLDVDLDDDSADDYVSLNDTHLIFVLSGVGEVPVPLGADISTPPVALSVDETIALDGTTYGTLTISGTTSDPSTIPENATFTVTPAGIGRGYYSVEYLEEGSNFVAGNLQRGDLVRIYIESPQAIGEDEEVRIKLIPKSGTPTTSIFTTPGVISTERVYLYP